MIQYMRERYIEIILAILNRINCIVEDDVLPDDAFENYNHVALWMNSDNPIKKYISKAMAEADTDLTKPLENFIMNYGTEVMSELRVICNEVLVKKPLDMHDAAIDVDIDRARLDTFLEMADQIGGTNGPDSKILRSWLIYNPTESGRENWS